MKTKAQKPMTAKEKAAFEKGFEAAKAEILKSIDKGKADADAFSDYKAEDIKKKDPKSQSDRGDIFDDLIRLWIFYAMKIELEGLRCEIAALKPEE